MAPKFVTDPLDPAGKGGQSSMSTGVQSTGTALPGATPAPSGNPTLPGERIAVVPIAVWESIRNKLSLWILAAPSPEVAQERKAEVDEDVATVVIERRTIKLDYLKPVA